MKKMMTLFAALILLAACAFGALAEDDFMYEDYEDGNPPLAPQITLPSNPTTGYRWTYEVDDPCLYVTDHGYVEGNPSLPGAGGSHSFRLDGDEAGYAEVTLSYARPWEDEPLYTFVYRVIIDEDYNVMIYEVEMR